jgi:hypothetical protein
VQVGIELWQEYGRALSSRAIQGAIVRALPFYRFDSASVSKSGFREIRP